MKNALKKGLAVLLALIVTLVPLFSVCASDSKSCPMIDVHGFMAKDIYADPADPDSEKIWPPTTDAILNAVRQSVPALTKFFLSKNWDALGKALVPIFDGLLGKACCGAEGTVTNSSGIRFSYPDKADVKPDGTYSFDYDWRLDPMEIAGQLDAFVRYITENAGVEKVRIRCHSLGGVIVLSYLTLYGNDKVDGVAFNSTALYGETYNGELMTGKMRLDADALSEFMRGNFSDTACPVLLAGIFDILNDSGVLKLACKCGNYAMDQLLDVAAQEILIPMFGNWLPIWAMVPDEYIADAEKYVFDTVWAGQDHSAIRAKVTAYNETVRKNREKTLRDLNENAKLVVLSRYGFSTIPIVPSWNVLSDGNIDTKNTSFGALTAGYGKMLSAEQLVGKDAKYISPEKNIDASCCLFPEQTWFIENCKHGYTPGAVDDMIDTLLAYDGQATVDTFPEYPRFVRYNPDTGTVTPHTEAAPARTFLQKLITALRELWNLILRNR